MPSNKLQRKIKNEIKKYVSAEIRAEIHTKIDDALYDFWRKVWNAEKGVTELEHTVCVIKHDPEIYTSDVQWIMIMRYINRKSTKIDAYINKRFRQNLYLNCSISMGPGSADGKFDVNMKLEIKLTPTLNQFASLLPISTVLC